MGYRRRRQCESQIYHVMARGVGRMLLFEDDVDRSRYLSFLDDALSRHDLDALAWCLMDNHIHLLVRGQLERVAKVMQLAGRSYALYFNRRHDHVGHLFQGRYASKPIEGNEHLLTVVRYIHQNPIESGASESCHYSWSSYGAYLGLPHCASRRFDETAVLGLLGSVAEFRRFHELPGSSFVATARHRPTSSMSMEAATAVLRGVLGEAGIGEVPLHDKAARDAIIVELRARGLSIRQVERLTGIGRGIVSRADGRLADE